MGVAVSAEQDPSQPVDLVSLRRSMVGVVVLTIGMAPGWAFVSFLGFAFNEQLGVSVTSVGLLAAAISVGYLAAAVPFAIRIDASAGHWSLTRAPFLLAAGFTVVVVTGKAATLGPMALLAGGLWAGSVAAINRYVYHIAPPDRQGTFFGITQTTVMSVSALGSFVLPSIAGTWGWRPALLTLASTAVVVGLTTSRLLPRESIESTRTATARTGVRAPLGPAYWWLLVYGLLMGAAMHDAFAFTLIFLRDEAGLSSTLGGVGLGMLFVGGAVGRAGWGIAMDRGFTSYQLLVVSSVGGAAAIGAIIMFSSSGAWLVVPVFLLGVLLLGHNTPFILLGMRTTPRERSAVVAAGLTMSHVAGGMFGPPLFGFMVDASGGYGAAWLVALLMLVASLGVLAITRRATTAVLDTR